MQTEYGMDLNDTEKRIVRDCFIGSYEDLMEDMHEDDEELRAARGYTEQDVVDLANKLGLIWKTQEGYDPWPDLPENK